MQVARNFRDLDLRALQRIGPFAIFGGDQALRLEESLCLMEVAQCARVLVFESLQAVLGSFEQILGMREPLMFLVQAFPLSGNRVEAGNFTELPLQPLSLFLAFGMVLTGQFQVVLRTCPVVPMAGEGHGVDPAVGVEQLAGAGGLQQALPCVLAVDVDQQGAQCAQLGGGHRRAVDPSAAFSLYVNGAAQQQFALFTGLHTQLIQHGAYRIGRVENGADVSFGRPFTHHLGFCARTHGQLQCFQQDGFAGAGFAGEHVEAILQCQVQ